MTIGEKIVSEMFIGEPKSRTWAVWCFGVWLRGTSLNTGAARNLYRDARAMLAEAIDKAVKDHPADEGNMTNTADDVLDDPMAMEYFSPGDQ